MAEDEAVVDPIIVVDDLAEEREEVGNLTTAMTTTVMVGTATRTRAEPKTTTMLPPSPKREKTERHRETTTTLDAAAAEEEGPIAVAKNRGDADVLVAVEKAAVEEVVAADTVRRMADPSAPLEDKKKKKSKMVVSSKQTHMILKLNYRNSDLAHRPWMRGKRRKHWQLLAWPHCHRIALTIPHWHPLLQQLHRYLSHLHLGFWEEETVCR